MAKAPSFAGLRSASESSSRAKRASSIHAGTKPEIILRRALSARKMRFRKNAKDLPGKPDIAFNKEKIAIFCDGDFWHGRNWRSLRKKLLRGTNSAYWIPKILSNMKRDRSTNATLAKLGWTVFRVWESDIKIDAPKVVQNIEFHVMEQRKSLEREQTSTKAARSRRD